MTFFAVPHVSIRRTKLAAAATLLALSALHATAAIVPTGVTLAAKQELVRNNGSEAATDDLHGNIGKCGVAIEVAP